MIITAVDSRQMSPTIPKPINKRHLILEEFRHADDDEFFPVKTIAALFKCSSVCVHNNTKRSGFIPFVRVGDRTFFQKKDVMEWLDKNKRQSN